MAHLRPSMLQALAGSSASTDARTTAAGLARYALLLNVFLWLQQQCLLVGRCRGERGFQKSLFWLS